MDKQKVISILEKYWETHPKKKSTAINEFGKPTRQCLYNSSTGEHCFIGILCCEGVRGALEEGKSILEQDEYIKGYLRIKFGEDSLHYLRSLQSIHDCNEVENWDEAIKKWLTYK